MRIEYVHHKSFNAAEHFGPGMIRTGKPIEGPEDRAHVEDCDRFAELLDDFYQSTEANHGQRWAIVLLIAGADFVFQRSIARNSDEQHVRTSRPVDLHHFNPEEPDCRRTQDLGVILAGLELLDAVQSEWQTRDGLPLSVTHRRLWIEGAKAEFERHTVPAWQRYY